MHPRASRGAALACASLVYGLLALPSHGSACLHVVEFTKDDAVAAVARADRLVGEGRAREAYRVALRARHRLEEHMRSVRRDSSTTAVIRRAQLVSAVAIVRLGGHTPVSYRTARRHVMRGRSERSLEWALERLQERAREAPSDLRVRAQLAEAMSYFPDLRPEAERILRDLMDRDLMPDAHGYAALTRITSPGSEAWNTALSRCATMAGEHRDAICPNASQS
ncbi:MAG: hypothetical protein AB7S26_28540 [Sandaracinaceae bacterium]